jgi:ABC-type bacteriocin/lantibiotic exporter with double-glycine peptidase domain
LSNIVGILNAGQQKKELSILNKYYDLYQKFAELSLKCTLNYKFILIPIMLLSVILFIVIGFNAVHNNELKVEKFVVCVMIYLYVFNSIIRVINDIRDAAIRSGMVKEHLKIFTSMKEAPLNQTPKKSTYSDKYIYFDKVNFSYENKPILTDFTLEVKKGEKLLIIGQIGSGKTTILKLLMRYSNASSGHIYYMGIPFESISREDIRKKIGYIPQNPILLNRSLYENITYGSPQESKEKVMSLIRELELDNIFDESSLDKPVGKHGSNLSGGQRQVVWILRVLVQNPEILIMDEPTSAIDKDTKHFIDRLFERVMKNRTTIVVSHDEYMSKLCDRTIKMST